MNVEPSLYDPPEYAALVTLMRQRGNLPAVKRAESATDRLDDLRKANVLLEAAQDLVDRLLDECAKDVADNGQMTTWERVGGVLGISKQGASQLHKRRSAARHIRL